MAVSVAAVAGTAKPQSIKFRATGTDGGGVASIPRATIVAALAEGPLKQLVSPASTFNALAANPRLAISCYANVAGPAGVATGVGFASGNMFFAVAGNVDAIVELRFVHSIEQ